MSSGERRRPTMNDRIMSDAYNLKKLIREAEALADESIIAMARLKQAMLAARQNPEIEIHTGQRARMRLTEAEDSALAMSTNSGDGCDGSGNGGFVGSLVALAVNPVDDNLVASFGAFHLEAKNRVA